jgi:tripeptide aminopeptidase
VNRQRAIDVVIELLSVPGVSCEERAVAETIVAILRRFGLPRDAVAFDHAHKKSPYGGNCGNLIVKLPGTTKGPRRMLSAHLDTVPICRDSQPVRQGNAIVSVREGTGVGADNRGGCAAVLTAAIEILEQKLPHPPLTLLFTIQEEIGLLGARYVDASLLGAPKLAFNFDGTSPESVEIGATGGMHMDIEIGGIASHAGGAPERGVSAAMIAALAFADLQRNGWFGLVKKRGVRGTSNVGTLHGGTATNVVMDRLTLDAECRSYSVPLRNRIARAYQKAFERAASQLSNADGRRGSVKFHCVKKYEAFKLPKRDPSVLEVQRALRSLGLRPVLEYSNGGLDANWLAVHGIHSPTLGAGSCDAHTVGEKLIVDQYLRGALVALRLATGS